MENETVLILLLLKQMTKTSQLNDIAIMIYHDGFPVLKHQFLVFCHYFDENHMKEMKMKKEIVSLLKPMTKTNQLNGKSKEDVFRCVLMSQMAFQDGGLKVSFHGL